QKEEELQFAVGAAVADVASSGPLWTPREELQAMHAATATTSSRRTLLEAGVGEGEGEGEGEEEGGVVDALDYVLFQLLYKQLEDHSPHMSGAAAVYLLSTIKLCGRSSPALGAYLPEVQAAFTRKLTVRSEFVQEVAGKGLAMVYELAEDDGIRQVLVEALVESLTSGKRRAAAEGGAGAAVGGVDVYGGGGGAAALSEAGAGAYGEMCSMAIDAGRPELIYSFLALSSHHTAWATRRQAIVGLGAGASVRPAAAGRLLAPQLQRIVPRIFRHRYDPSAKTRTAMEQLWRSVISGGGEGGAAANTGGEGAREGGGGEKDFSSLEKQVVSAHFDAIIKELLRGLGDRKWRNRQSSCSALSDLLMGRTWGEVGAYLEDLWTMADRVMDDIKESVVGAAADFAKTLANVSVRLCDPGATTTPAAAWAGALGATDAPDPSGREEIREASRAVGSMLENLRLSEEEAQRRGEGGEEGSRAGSGAREGDQRATATGEALQAALEDLGRGSTREGPGGTSRGGPGPSVAEVLRGGRGRPGGEGGGGHTTAVGALPSEEALKATSGAVSVVLPWLLRRGILSRCQPSQALSMRTLTRVVRCCGQEALGPHLPELVATLIEGMSALEPQALQYMQFHAESQLDMSQEQMERLRLSVSRSGPLQDALDHCYRHLDDSAVTALLPHLLSLLRSGTGLATRSAAAYLVLSLCERTPGPVQAASPRLLPTLTNAALSEPSTTLRRAYSSALSSVARLSAPGPVGRLSERLCSLFKAADPGFDQRQRRAVAVLLGDLARRAGEQLWGQAIEPGALKGVGAAAGTGKGGIVEGEGEEGVAGARRFASTGWAQVMPLAFVARHDPDKAVAVLFMEAWEEGLTRLQLGGALGGHGVEGGSGPSSCVRTAKDAVTLMVS
ncbi:unnamed protein product, partial [Discosporangium mesarthrocarpum]